MKKYLIFTSVVFHIVIIISLFWIVPFFYSSIQSGKEWASASENSEIGIVENVSVIKRDNVINIGYHISLNGNAIYLSGSSDKKYKVGDKLDIHISEHPYPPLDTLMITILGVHRGVDD
jgi:hypothetical protein